MSALLAGCSSASASLRPVLTKGLKVAEEGLSPLADDFTLLGETAPMRVPSALEDALRQADDAVRTGSQLDDEEQLLLARGERWAAFVDEVNSVFASVTGWEVAIPDDAVRLVNASLVREPSPQFRSVVVELEEKVLTGAACQAARNGLDAAGAQQADSVQEDYVEVGLTSTDIQQYLQFGLSLEGDVDAVHTVNLAGASVDRVNRYLDGFEDVVDSPNGTIATANFIYFRSCVLKRG